MTPGLHVGTDAATGRAFRVPRSSFDTHWHLIGGTGKGKTTAIHTVLHRLLADPLRPACVVVIDRLGGMSRDLLLWAASPFCPRYVRDRLVYVEPAREDVVIGFNPLVFTSPANAYYRVAMASEIVLRGWSSQNLQEMPRLGRWLFSAFYSASQLGLTVSDCAHFLNPDSPLHRPLLGCLPPALQAEWRQIAAARGDQAVVQLESTRNRLRPYFLNPILRATFGSSENRLDLLRFMRERRFVLLNLNPGGSLDNQVADAFGGLVINEVLTLARSLPAAVRYPTYLVLDEMQRYVGPDLEAAIPEVRQLGIKLLLSHQSLAQLQRGDTDLTALIFQCQSRMAFGVQGEDADVLAHEFASLTYDPRRVKDERYTRRQWLTGHRVVELASRSFSESAADSWSATTGRGWTRGEAARRGDVRPVESEGASGSESSAAGGTRTRGSSAGSHEQLVPVYDEFLELADRTYAAFDEQKQEWARDVRQLARGRCVVRLVDDPGLYTVDVVRDTPGYLGWDLEALARYFPRALEEKDALVEANFRQEWFCPPSAIERETEARLRRVLCPPVEVRSVPDAAATSVARVVEENAWGN